MGLRCFVHFRVLMALIGALHGDGFYPEPPKPLNEGIYLKL